MREMSKVGKKVRRELPDLSVIEPFTPEVVEFDDVQEFREYLADHEEEMNQMTTQKLNKAYKINGYYITKIKSKGTDGKVIPDSDPKICLKKATYVRQISNDMDYHKTLLKLIEQVEAIKDILRENQLIPPQ